MSPERAKDRRVQKTERQLRDALVALIHEKSYDSIVVKEILDRADVGRSAFYSHFQGKDALLASGIEHILHAAPSTPLPARAERFRSVVWFSRPIFEFIGQCRHMAHPRMDKRGRTVIHQHLRRSVVGRITEDVTALPRRHRQGGKRVIPPELIAEHVASTFVLVLNWWVENRCALSPAEVNELFLSMVLPVLDSL